MSDYLMLGLLLICMRYDEKVYYKVLDNTYCKTESKFLEVREKDFILTQVV